VNVARQRLDPDTRCANIQCPNLLGEGLFELMSIDTRKPIGAGARTLTLLLCGPCASAFMDEA
jgi:hypothetical protein